MRACLFCGDRPVTNEDVIPLWIAELLRVGRVTVTDYVNRRPEHERVDSFGLLTGFFCGPRCNQGWMSALEEEVRPFLGPMLLGHRNELTPPQCEAIARWTWKTALTADPAGRRQRIFDDRDYREFFETRRVPDRTLMWIGGFRVRQHGGPKSAANMSLTRTVIKIDGLTLGYIRHFTLSVGGVILQARSMRTGRMFKYTDERRGQSWSDVCTQFWPAPAELVRPPGTAIDRGDFPDFAMRWSAAEPGALF